MKKIAVFLFVLAVAAMAQTTQVLPEHNAGAGYFSTPFYIQWYNTTTSAYVDTLWMTGLGSKKSQVFRMWPYMGGQLFVTGADSVKIRAIELWTSTGKDTSKFAFSKLLYSSLSRAAADTSISSAGTYACDFATNGAWNPTLYGMLKVKFSTGQKLTKTNYLRFPVQGWNE